MNGLWTVEFGSQAGAFGSGVVVLSGGIVMGGDNGYYYTGDYRLGTQGGFSVNLTVTPFISGLPNVFGMIGKFQLQFKGILAEDGTHARAAGHLVGSSGELGAKMTKRA